MQRRNSRLSAWLLATAFLPGALVHAAELTGRASLLGAAADAQGQTRTSDQESLRLMLEGTGTDMEWSVHAKAARQHLGGAPATTRHSSALFRYRDYAGDWHSSIERGGSTRAGYELDRAVYKRRIGRMAIGLGRQPIDWGAGRFWQPLNVFGAFAPTDLDTDFKPGIDAAVLDWYPSAFSSWTAVYALAPKHDPAIDDSGALSYRGRVGERSELSAVAGRVVGDDVVGAAFESEWAGIGWRIEAARYRQRQAGDGATFWIAGADYQFANGTLLAVEWHDDGRGASDVAGLTLAQTDPLVTNGLRQHLGRKLLGVAIEKDLTPLLRGSYKLFVSPLRDTAGRTRTSTLHQVSLVYSVGNESDLLVALLFAEGQGFDAQGRPQSEFGHVPKSVTARWQYYF